MVDGIFDDVVAFSEIEQFIDTQVKFYSSGMYVRLAFAVAVNVDPDILVVDEVLAVGDERFQAKCVDRIRRFQEEGRTILLVTHNADQVRALCDRAIVLEGGAHDRRRTDAATRCGSSASTHGRTPSSTIEAHLLGTIQHRVGDDARRDPSRSRAARDLHFDVNVSSQSAYSGNFVIELFTRNGAAGEPQRRAGLAGQPRARAQRRRRRPRDRSHCSTGSTTSTSASSTTTATR